MAKDTKDDPHLPIYMQRRFNPFRTANGWDFSGFMERPSPFTGRAALNYILAQPNAVQKQEKAKSVSRPDDGGLLEELAIHAFYAAGNADNVWGLMTVYDAEEIKDGESLFVVNNDLFEVIRGYNKSLMEVPPLDEKFVRFDSGHYKVGKYIQDQGRIAWRIDTSFPADNIKTAVIPERLILEKCVYRFI